MKLYQRPKCKKLQKYRKRHRRESFSSWFRQRFLLCDNQSKIHKRIIDKLELIYMKNFALQKIQLRERNDKLKTTGKYLKACI